MTKEILNKRRKCRLSMEGANFRSKMQMHKLSIKSWFLSGLRERKKWMEGGFWCLYTMQKHLAGPVIGAWIGGSMASVCLPACVRGMGDGSVCTYPTSCAPASKAEEFRQVLQVIGPGVFQDIHTSDCDVLADEQWQQRRKHGLGRAKIAKPNSEGEYILCT